MGSLKRTLRGLPLITYPRYTGAGRSLQAALQKSYYGSVRPLLRACFVLALMALPRLAHSVDYTWGFAWADRESFENQAIPQDWEPLVDPSLGYSTRVLWLRLTLRNPTPGQKLVVEESYGLDLIDLYEDDDGLIRRTRRSGWARGYDGLEFFHGKNHFVLDVTEANANNIYYLSMRTDTAFFIDFEVLAFEEFVQRSLLNWILAASLMGLALGMVVYHLALAISLRSALYRDYTLFLVFTTIVLGWNLGVGHILLWPFAPALGNYVGPVGIYAALGLLVRVVYNLLNEDVRQRGPWRFFPHLSYALFALAVLSIILPSSIRSMLAIFLALFGSFVVAVIITYHSIRNSGSIRLVSVALLSLLVGAILYISRTFGILPDTPVTQRALDFGYIAEMLFFGMAVAKHFSLLQDELQQSRAELEEFTHGLEDTIQARTIELEQKNDQLQRTVENLQAAQETIIRSEKLASLGRTVAGVAHEINTPLGNCVMLASFLEETLVQDGNVLASGCDDGRVAEALENLKSNLRRSTQIVDSFRLITGSAPSKDAHTETAEFIPSYSAIDRQRLKSRGIRIEWVYPRDMKIPMDSVNLVLIFDSLLDNVGHHAYPEGWSGSGTPRVRITLSRGRRYFRISVRDWGRGIDPEALAFVFDPFYSVRRTAGRPGLGLSTVFNIVKLQHGGEVRAQCPSGGGTVIHILLPVERMGTPEGG
jgi:signal transduction histidine kinase